MSRFSRTNFYYKNIIDGNLEIDLLNNFYNLVFKIKRPLSFYTLRQQDLQRPDLISYKIYGDVNYWWILFKYNQIDDIWNDLEIGQVISIPSKQDIEDFYIESRKLKGI